MKRSIICIICITIALMIAGCNEETLTFAEPTLEVSKKGEISQTIVENFDKTYYDIQELQNYMNAAINECNASLGDKGEVSLKDVHVEDGKVFATIDFDSMEAIESFNGEKYFYGSVNDAYDAGYSLDISMKSVSDGSVIGKTEVMEMKKKHILIVPDSGIIKTGYKILYVSAAGEAIDDKTVRVSSDADGLVYIVMK